MKIQTSPVNQRAKSNLHSRERNINPRGLINDFCEIDTKDKQFTKQINKQSLQLVKLNSTDNQNVKQSRQNAQIEVKELKDTIQSLEMNIQGSIEHKDLSRIKLMSAPDNQYNHNQDRNNNHQNKLNVKFDMAYGILDAKAAISDSPLLTNKNQQSHQELLNQISPQSYNKHREAFSIKKYMILKQQAEKDKAEKKFSLKDEYYSIMNRLENVQPKDLKSKIKNLIDDSYQQRNLLEAQKHHNKIKTQINNMKYQSPLKRVKKLDLQTLQKTNLNEITQSTFDRERDIQQQLNLKREASSQSQNKSSNQGGLIALSAIQQAYQKRIQMELEKKQRSKMIDLKLNHMVTHLQERLGFVTKKQKMDHVMYRLASNIEKQVKGDAMELNSKIYKQEFKIAPFEQDDDNYSDNKQDKIKDDKSNVGQSDASPIKPFIQKVSEGSSPNKYQSVNIPRISQLSSLQPSMQSNRKSLNQTELNSPTKSTSRNKLHSFQQSYSNRFKSLSPKRNQIQEQNPYNQIIKEKILDKSPRPINLNEDNELFYLDNNLVMEFLQSLYSDQDWSSIASDEQFEKIMSLLSDYYGMKDIYENKYKKLPRYLLAQQQSRSINKGDENHIGSEKDSKSRQGSRQKNQRSSSKRPEQLIGVESSHGNNLNLNIFSDDEYDHKQQREEKLFEKLINQVHLDSTVMKEKFVMERYTAYLNKCLFITSDDFIKRKFKAFMEKNNPKKSENFFARMQKDQERRHQQDKIIQQLNNLPHPLNNNKLNQTMESSILQDGTTQQKARYFLDVPNINLIAKQTKKNVSSKQTDTSLNKFSDFQYGPSGSLNGQDEKIMKQLQDFTNSTEIKLQSSRQSSVPINYAKLPYNNTKAQISSQYKQSEEQCQFRQNSKDLEDNYQILINQPNSSNNNSKKAIKVQSQHKYNRSQQKSIDFDNELLNNQKREYNTGRIRNKSQLKQTIQSLNKIDQIQQVNAIDEKIKQLQSKVMAKKFQQTSPIKIRIM